jgi:hypothetical protein
MEDLGAAAHDLLVRNSNAWDMLRRNVEELRKVRVRTFPFDGFTIKAQFNPGRLASVSARTDPQTILKRQCFLCDTSRPPEQQAIELNDGFKILCNPYPILPAHFTIIHGDHRPQRVLDLLRSMLLSARGMAPRYTVFYNGPQCGASAPDHLHYQAGTRGFMPIDDDYDRVKRPIGRRGGVEFFAGECLRRFISLESNDLDALEAGFSEFHENYHAFQPNAPEPMMNVICTYVERTWRLIAFTRNKHRPEFYFANDHTRMMLSPGAVDIGGVVVVPREEDFARLTVEHIADMYEQVSLPHAQFHQLQSTFGE